MRSLFESESTQTLTTARIVPERAIDRYPDGLTYLIPESLPDLAVGQRVLVPLGRGDAVTPGYVVEVGGENEIDPGRLKHIVQRDPHGIGLPGDLLELAKWIAGYYAAPLGSVLATMLPAAVKRGTGRQTLVMVDLAAPPPEEASDADEEQTEKKRKPTAVQQRILEALKGAAVRPIEIRALADLAGLKTTGPVRRMIQRGLLTEVRRSAVRALWDEVAILPDAEVTLTEAQARIIESIAARLKDGFGVHVINGVTGSGKTEIYLRLIERLCQGSGPGGRSARHSREGGNPREADNVQVDARLRGHDEPQAPTPDPRPPTPDPRPLTPDTTIVLVPEIALTPQVVGRFMARFGDAVAILHSGLTAAQRHEQWSLVRRGEKRIVVGARSAVFAPVPAGRLAMIVVDEEHDSSYKQDQAPRYHARDVAIKRAQLAGAAVILGSATPSMETWFNAKERGVYSWHELPERVPGARLPRVEIVDFRAEQRRRTGEQRKHIRLIGPRLEQALVRTLESGGQAILLLNRRGYANYIACPDQNCGWVMTCEHCDVAMVYHKEKSLPLGGTVRCHHCLAEQLLPTRCPTCGRKVVAFGMGTQRIEEELTRFVPGVEPSLLLRMDADTMHRARDYYEALGRFGAGEVRILLGTQMIAKGLDFPNVHLVGVINADTSIHLPDFRSAERTFQLVSQVAGRCGRGEKPGLVIVQTFQPSQPAIRLAAEHRYEDFARMEIEQRRRAMLPPVGRLARIVVRDRQFTKANERAKRLAERLRELIRAGGEEGVRLRGPAPCPLSRIADHFRIGLELLAPGPKPIQRLLVAIRNEGLAVSDAATAIDVDPVNLL